MKIPAIDAEIDFFPNFIAQRQSYDLLAHLTDVIDWRQDTISMYGKEHQVPRLQAWFGDDGADYQYSGLKLTPMPWLPALAKLRKVLSEYCSEQYGKTVSFNSALVNLYRDNNDCVGWHSDDEPELGDSPIIASVSLGQAREFKLKHKCKEDKLAIKLTSGSLLLMSGQCQSHWQHAILRSKKSLAPRINITFREVYI